MLGIGAIILFALSLIICLLIEASVIYALIAGYIIFMLYGLISGYPLKKLIKLSYKGLLKVRNIIMVFMLIGIITALWRASGTIAFIIFYGSKLITPSIFILLSFLLCSLLSILIGTSFGTVATMGVICISLARAMGLNENYVAGAILSGIYLGDRNSPMSTSALFVAEITKTDLFENIKEMIKTSIIPFVISCIFYVVLGLGNSNTVNNSDVSKIFLENYNLNIITLMPAILIILLSIFKINVKITMVVSIVVAMVISILFQNESINNLLNYMIHGYFSENIKLNSMMKGGGMLSMVNVSLIIAISGTYSGIFSETDVLKKLKEYIGFIAKKITDFGAVLITAVIACAIACNQNLASILTVELCKEIMPTKKLAIAIENTVIVIASLIPWSIAMAVPLRTLEVSSISGIYAFYLYVLPLWNFYLAVRKRRKNNIYYK